MTQQSKRPQSHSLFNYYYKFRPLVIHNMNLLIVFWTQFTHCNRCLPHFTFTHLFQFGF